MKIKDISKHFDARRIEDKDMEQILVLENSNPLYFEYCPPTPSLENILADRIALPPNKESKDKYYLGYFDGKQLIAVLDLILFYPDTQTAYIGFFMVHADFSGKGLGSQLIDELVHFCKKAGFKFLRLGRIKGNPQPEAFWAKNKFIPTGIETQREHDTVVGMEREL